ncbi:mannose-1-phosphate guanylyltransferase [Georgenia sp. Z1344]|uniref:mannose-1-phosphate guanylyltransferase n=1 Tax=Georgenia sp. Z1344 TaxID=3416706 RepID=UPI003CF3C7F3
MSVPVEPDGVPVIHAIVPAGGAGTRLWPLSRRDRPKFLLDLTGSGRSLLEATVGRLAPLAATTTIVTGVAHAEAVAEQVGDRAEVVAEPSPRDSMAAIGLAAAILAERHGPDAVIGSFAADHLVTDEAAFVSAVAQAAVAARRGDVSLVTVGLTPTHPATGFGYIAVGEPLGEEHAPDARRVDSFVEKPDAATARTYVHGGAHLWNAGMFVALAGDLLDALAELHPELATGLGAVGRAWDTPERDAVLDETWPTLTRIAIDHALAEPLAAEGRVAVVPADLGWTDVGDADSLASVLVPDDRGVAAAPGTRIVAEDAEGAFVHAPGRTVALLGVPGVVVVDTGDALLVTTRERAQGVKGVVDSLEGRGLGHLA